VCAILRLPTQLRIQKVNARLKDSTAIFKDWIKHSIWHKHNELLLDKATSVVKKMQQAVASIIGKALFSEAQ